MSNKMIRTTGKSFRASRKKLEVKLWLYSLLGWKKNGNFLWDQEGDKIITSHEVIKW